MLMSLLDADLPVADRFARINAELHLIIRLIS